MIWRGWGILVFLCPIIWWIVLIAVSMATGIGNSKHDGFWLMLTLGLALAFSAATLWPFSRYRERVAPSVDHFFFIPTKYCIYLLLIAAVGVGGWAFIAPNP
jgi:hypothetical protein